MRVLHRELDSWVSYALKMTRYVVNGSAEVIYAMLTPLGRSFEISLPTGLISSFVMSNVGGPSGANKLHGHISSSNNCQPPSAGSLTEFGKLLIMLRKAASTSTELLSAKRRRSLQNSVRSETKVKTSSIR